MPLVRSKGRRRRWDMLCMCVAMFFVPQFIVGLSNIVGLNAEALEAKALATSSGSAAKTINYTYDANGNLVSKAVVGGVAEAYTYDNENHLTLFDPDTTSANDQVSYAYDHDGVRISKSKCAVLVANYETARPRCIGKNGHHVTNTSDG